MLRKYCVCACKEGFENIFVNFIQVLTRLIFIVNGLNSEVSVVSYSVTVRVSVVLRRTVVVD